MKEIIITSSVLILAVMLLRLLFRNIVSKKLIYAAWLLVAARLLIPVQIGQVDFSVLTRANQMTEAITQVADKQVAGVTDQDAYREVIQDYVETDQSVFMPQVQEQIQSAINNNTSNEQIAEMLDKVYSDEEVFVPEVQQQVQQQVAEKADPITLGQVVTFTWLIGVAVMAIWFITVNFLFSRRLKRTAKTVEIKESPMPVKISGQLSSPCLFGFFRPTVYLTPNCSEDDQIRRHVLTHELTHLSHKDHIWSLIRCACLCLYWFNPLVWAAAFLSKRDCELACDESVLKKLGEEERLLYGKTLVDMVATNPSPANLMEAATAMHETKKALKERVNHIVKKRKHLLISALCLILVLSIVTGCSFTGQKTGAPSTTDPAETSEPAGTTEPDGTTKPTETTVPPESGSWETEEQDYGKLSYEAKEEIRNMVIEDNAEEITGNVRVLAPLRWTPAIETMIEAFNKDYPNITVEVVRHYWGNETDGRLNVVLRDGEADVIFSQGLNATMNRKESGLLRELDYSCLHMDKFTRGWNSGLYNTNGRYFLPCAGTQYYIAINYDAWKEAGLGDLPTAWTWDEYLYVCEKMTKVNEDGSIRYGGSMDASCNTALYSYTQVYGKDMFYAYGGMKSSFSDPIVLNALERQLQAELTDKYWYPVVNYFEENKKANEAYLNGEVASVITSDLTGYLAYIEEYPQVDWITAFAPYPTEEKEQTNYMAGVHSDTYVAIAANCQDETAAWMFTKWASTYGGNYLAINNQFSNWRLTNPDDIVNAIFGSHKIAKDIIDTTSFKQTVGQANAPTYREQILTEYSAVSKAHKGYIRYALAGTMSANESLKYAAQEADAILYERRYETAFKQVQDYGYEGDEGKYLAALCYQDIDKFLDYAAQVIDPDSQYSDACYYWAIIDNATAEQRAQLKDKCLAVYRDPNATFRQRYTAARLAPLSTDEERAMRSEAMESHTEIEFEAAAVLVKELDPAYLPMWRPDAGIYTSYESLIAHQNRIKELGENGAYDGTVTSSLSPKSHDEVIKQYDEDFFEDHILFEVLIEVSSDTTKLPIVQKVTTGEPCYWMDRFCVFLEYKEDVNNDGIDYDLYVIFIAVPREYYKEPIRINDYDFAFNCCVNGEPFQVYG